MDPQKPGYLTTEWWTTMATTLVSLAAVVFGMNAASAGQLSDTIVKVVLGIFALLSQASVTVKYIEGRNVLKQAMLVPPQLPVSPSDPPVV